MAIMPTRSASMILYTVVVDNDEKPTLTNVVLTDNFEGGGNVALRCDGPWRQWRADVGEVVLTGDTNGNSQMETTESGPTPNFARSPRRRSTATGAAMAR